jgi:hypothetical protein
MESLGRTRRKTCLSPSTPARLTTSWNAEGRRCEGPTALSLVVKARVVWLRFGCSRGQANTPFLVRLAHATLETRGLIATL